MEFEGSQIATLHISLLENQYICHMGPTATSDPEKKIMYIQPLKDSVVAPFGPLIGPLVHLWVAMQLTEGQYFLQL